MSIATVRTTLCLGLLTLASEAHSADLTLPRDGWTSWQVAAVEGAPDWCCWSSWNDRDASRASCKLDQNTGNFGGRDRKTTDSVRVYARLSSGKVEQLRALSATCPVEARTPIQELGTVSADDSARWLSALARRDDDAFKSDDLRDNVLAALAIHRSDVAQNSLTEIARGKGSAEARKKAIFWLAQSGAPGAEATITAALREDQDGQVRVQAIFALSQLPDERATRALVAVAEDRSLSHEQRKRAVFWLAQSETAGAQKYLEKVLMQSAGNR